MTTSADDTIVALATPPGRGGLGVVRLSGPAARAITERVVRFARPPRWRPWTAQFGELLDDAGAVVDQAVVLYFAAPRSYTGEDVVELSLHGAPVVLAACVARAQQLGARHATPGEFTRRAVRNGRLDVTQAEAVRGLIEATTLHQARLAARQTSGELARRVAAVKDALLDLTMHLEAGIDFVEQGVEALPSDEIERRLAAIRAPLATLAAGYQRGRLVRSGRTVALVGRPNVGKSSLFNALLGRDRAIVTPVPGTTRDVVAETVELDGIPIRLLDTAGLHASADEVERLGMARTREALAAADLVAVLVDGSVPPHPDDAALVVDARAAGETVLVATKADLPAAPSPADLRVSAHTGENLDALRRLLVPAAGESDALVTDARHAALLDEALAALDAASATLPHDLLLADLRAALRPLDELTGPTVPDDLLDRIFATFCLGK